MKKILTTYAIAMTGIRGFLERNIWRLAKLIHVFHFGLLRSEMVSGWPSGHTIIAFAMSVTLFWLFPQKRWLGAASLLYAFYVGLSVSMTVHWFSDFASGIIFGIIVGTTVGRSFAAMDFPSRSNGVENVQQGTSSEF